MGVAERALYPIDDALDCLWASDDREVLELVGGLQKGGQDRVYAGMVDELEIAEVKAGPMGVCFECPLQRLGERLMSRCVQPSGELDDRRVAWAACPDTEVPGARSGLAAAEGIVSLCARARRAPGGRFDGRPEARPERRFHLLGWNRS